MYVGAPVKRLEDRRFLTGRGSFVDDIVLPGTVQAIFVRSPHPHAKIKQIKSDRASKVPGVLGIYTGKDCEEAGLGRFVVWSPVHSRDNVARPEETQFMLALGKVLYVGEPVVLVVAETKYAALTAADEVEIDYEPLPFITDTSKALDDDVPVIHDSMESNLVFDIDMGDKAATEAAFAAAAHVTEITLTNNRITANPMEPRAILANYDSASDGFTLWVSHQAPHMLKRDLAQNTLKHPEHKIRVVSPDVGGGFGMKVANHPEEPLLLWASRRVGRPVRWTSTRSEGLIADSQARDHWTKCKMALDGNGKILAISADTLAGLGAFQTRMGASIPAHFYSRSLIGLYKMPTAYCRVRGVHTNTPPIQAYRGAGRPEAIYVLESLVDNAAVEMGIDLREIRRRNFILKDEFPYKVPFGITYDTADPIGLLDKGADLFGYDQLREKQKAMRSEGGLQLGIGVACFIDCVGTPSKVAAAMGRKIVGGWDSAAIRILPSGKITVLAGSHSHGQGHATSYAQIAADWLGCPINNIDVVEGDTDRVQFGHGTWGSRSTITSGIAVAKAAQQLQLKCRKIAAHMLECADDDVIVENGVLRIPGTDRSVTLEDVAQTAYQGGNLPPGMEPSLEQLSFHDPADRSFASGIHYCAVLVDPETGRVKVHKYAVIDDCGTIINPIIIKGQAHGGIAQGVGQALMEDCTFDHTSGQPLSGTFMDYAMPRAIDFPPFDVGVQETPAPSNPLGVKGAGESGTIGALAAVRNAVVDALRPQGIKHIDMPMTPARVWAAIEAAKTK